uniref:Uncharacterized protein n=1 Tax=Arundo donax TaxID=35708 RepID=A0A0A8ZSX8_ARUDO
MIFIVTLVFHILLGTANINISKLQCPLLLTMPNIVILIAIV